MQIFLMLMQVLEYNNDCILKGLNFPWPINFILCVLGIKYFVHTKWLSADTAVLCLTWALKSKVYPHFTGFLWRSRLNTTNAVCSRCPYVRISSYLNIQLVTIFFKLIYFRTTCQALFTVP